MVGLKKKRRARAGPRRRVNGHTTCGCNYSRSHTGETIGDSFDSVGDNNVDPAFKLIQKGQVGIRMRGKLIDGINGNKVNPIRSI